MLRIAIDGPGGAGKSTVARMLAERLGIFYMDTGAMYRASAYKAKESGVNIEDKQALSEMMNAIDLDIYEKNGSLVLCLDGKQLGNEIRTDEISRLASDISAVPECRKKLTDLQKKLASENDLVMEGRDIGTVVIPDAEVKIFLVASPEERAERRYKELLSKGKDVSYEEVKDQLFYRDKQDSSRKEAPLKMAEDAHLINSDGKSIEDVLEEAQKLIAAFRKERA